MKLIVVGDSGDIRVINEVLAYDCVTKEDIDYLVSDMKLNVNLTKEQLEIISHRCDKFEHFPDYDDLRWLIGEVVKGTL